MEKFTEEYLVWAKDKKYHRSKSKAEAVYELASSGIPTLSSSTPSTKMLVQEAISVLRTVDRSLLRFHYGTSKWISNHGW